MIRRKLRELKPLFFGKRRYQRFWERLHSWSLEGMNIGRWEGPLDSGELWVLRYASKYIHDRSHQSRNPRDGDRPVIFDVGANIGLYSLEVLRSFGDRARLFSFEPSQSTYQLLKEALAGFDNVECINAGLSDREQARTLYSVPEDAGLSSVYNRFRFDDGNNRQIQDRRTEAIKLTTVDCFCRERGIEKIDLLKVDVEGHELQVLLGARALLQNQAIDFIQFEFGGTDVDAKTFLHDFVDLLHSNFALFRIVRDGIVSVEPYHEKREIFLYSNYLAVSRELEMPWSSQLQLRRDLPLGF